MHPSQGNDSKYSLGQNVLHTVDPFSVIRRSSVLIIYLLFLNDEDDATLTRLGCGTFHPSFTKPLFNYPGFIKSLNQFQVQQHVRKYLENLISPFYDFNNTELLVLFNTICELIFKLVISNDVSLNSLYLNICYDPNLRISNEICKKPKFLSDIKYFTLDFNHDDEIPHLPKPSFQNFFEYLPTAITSNKHFTIYFSLEENISKRNLEYLIQSQTQLLSLTLHSITTKVTYILNALKYCSNTLTSIKFNNCDFTNMSSLNGLNSLAHLESLHFKYCEGITVQVFRPLLDIPTPLKIKTLKIVSQIEEITLIQLLFQKIGSFLENLEINLWKDTERNNVYESIINYCEKIQFLHLLEIDHVDIPQLIKLIIHVRKHLKYLSLQVKNNRRSCISYRISKIYVNEPLRVSSMILENLGQILPDTLKYLELRLEIDPINLKIFLNNCKHIVGLSRLLVMNKNLNDNKDAFKVLKEFVREKKVMNFAYLVNHNLFIREDEYKIYSSQKLYSDLIMRVSYFENV
ncbi:4195_t:CDS:2 [Funneliformis caledonium]|uniref:4195_t:CDS:1 n=1 Tax=Funneliformis caledonium TaxID=1117310 RepID=A0A9N9BFJ3_9GLOM|nr:4195_t:CDS:2 [Funneliformis caledonium]